MAPKKKTIKRQKRRENRDGHCFGYKVNDKIAHDIAYFVRHGDAYLNMVVEAGSRTKQTNYAAMYSMLTLNEDSTLLSYSKQELRENGNFQKGRGPAISSNDLIYSGCQSQTTLAGQNAYLAFIIIEGGYYIIGRTHPLFTIPSMTFLFIAYK